MGGHGGLNILPQKRWNVYNYDNREKVRRDEEAASREEQLKREQSRKRDAEFRLERLRTARGLPPLNKSEAELEPEPEPRPEPAQSEPKSNHINLFEGMKIFDPIKELEKGGDAERDGSRKKKMKKEEVRVVTAEEEKYRLGYGVAGKGVKLPWYLEKRSDDVNEEKDEDDGSTRGKKEGKKSGKKTLQELREERLKREKQEKERVRALLENKQRDRAGFRSGMISRR
ncbi:leukocyte receptor cluster member 1 [Manihot esculenta]|uniref:CBF1-interacting co-repressor CIR N-terminal domain-containing protein n=2 Tax=Manihot esculenta TaxID=3983 RepID=A0A2C9WIU9_MANES|nr:leukocyte receptor cluster member 1 [Manihot esculenta]XP_021598010.1 leukocyte receptor cluster member 1 [Manihot esculenta]KAG8662240.1 hypothetical protein MANES_01G079600v8 [Manihot esculenta]OAY60017.1 hypothetical protein MANES_01G079600v8 [Manihot esculenta]